MRLGCQHSPSISGGVAQWEVTKKNSESRQGARSGVVNVSREWSRERELQMGVANMSREWE